MFVGEIEGTERLSRHMVDAINQKILSLKKQGRKEKKINLESDTLFFFLKNLLLLWLFGTSAWQFGIIH